MPLTQLPAGGRRGATPVPPASYEFGPAAADWWAWAWATPQAAGWDDGQLFTVARRASLEDDLVTLAKADLDVADLLGMKPSDLTRELGRIFGLIKALAGGRLSVVTKMTDLDDRLGLTPKGLAALRWKIVPDEAEAEAPVTGRKGLTLINKTG